MGGTQYRRRAAPARAGPRRHRARLVPVTTRLTAFLSTALGSSPLRHAPFRRVLPRVDRRGARLHDAGDDRRVADGHADAVGADGGAGADRQHRAVAAVRPGRRRARRHRRSAPRDPRHADRAAGGDRRCSASPRSAGSIGPATLLLAHVPDRRRLHVLHAGAAGEHQRAGVARRTCRARSRWAPSRSTSRAPSGRRSPARSPPGWARAARCSRARSSSC